MFSLKKCLAVCALFLALGADSFAAEKDLETIQSLKKKVDALNNMEIEYEVKNMFTGKTNKVTVYIRDLRTIRLEYGSLVSIIDNGKVLIYDMESKKGQIRDSVSIFDEYAKETAGFFKDNEKNVQALTGKNAEEALKQIAVREMFPGMLLRIDRDRNFDPVKKPDFHFQVTMKLQPGESDYSWLREIDHFCSDPKLKCSLKEFNQHWFLSVGDREYWIYKDTGLLYQQGLIDKEGKPQATLTCKTSNKNVKFKAGFFDCKAPEGFEIQELKKEDMHEEIAASLHTRFMSLLGEGVAAKDWTKADEESKARVVQLSEAWQTWLFRNHFLSEKSRDDRIKGILDDFKGLLEEIKRKEPDRLLAEQKAWKVQVDTLNEIDNYSKRNELMLRDGMIFAARRALEGREELKGESKEAFINLVRKGISESYNKIFNIELHDVIKTKIRDLAKEMGS